MKQGLSPAVIPDRIANPLRVEPGHSVVVWSPERVRLDPLRYGGLTEIPPFEFAVIHDRIHMTSEMTDEQFQAGNRAGAAEEIPLRPHRVPAYLVAEEFLQDFGPRGLVIVEKLTDQAVGTLQKIEALLFRDASGPVRFASFAHAVEHLNGLSMDAELAGLLQPVITQISGGLARAREWWRSYAAQRIAEAELAKTKNMGRGTFTEEERVMCLMADQELPADVLGRDRGKEKEDGLSREEVLALITEAGAAQAAQSREQYADLLADVLNRVLPAQQPAAPAGDNKPQNSNRK